MRQRRELNPLRQMNKRETKLISDIADRAWQLCLDLGEDQPSRIGIIISVAMVHRDLPLDLEMLLTTDDGNFAHDVFGIMRHLNRTTGKLENCFVPRTARFQHA